MRVPTAWIGGNHNDITTAIDKTDNKVLLKLLPVLQQYATAFDVVLLYLGSKDYSPPPLIRVKVSFDAVSIDQLDEEFGRLMVEAERKLAPPGSTITLARFERNRVTAGHPAARVVVRIMLPSGETLFRVDHIISRPSDNLMMHFYVGAAAYNEIVPQFDAMLRTLRYG